VSPSSQPQASPQRILSTLQAYRNAAALATAIELELFTRIAHGSDTPNKIAAELAVPVLGIRILCNYLAEAGLLMKDGEELQLAEDSAAFLDKASPSYIGHAADVLHSLLLRRRFERLSELVRGEAGVESSGLADWFDLSRGFIDRAAAVRAFTDALVLPSGPLKILDVGAGDGTYGIALALRFPQAVVVAVDRPSALKVAHQNAAQAQLGTRYQNIPGDLLSKALGTGYDAAIVVGQLNQLEPAEVELSMKRIRDALKKSGQLFILEFLSEDSPEYADFALTVLAATRRGAAYSLAEVKQKLYLSGFSSIESQPLAEARATLVTARP
jgi:ubiquinone/menaquinone biosynthesis C-methylase UbiE